LSGAALNTEHCQGWLLLNYTGNSGLTQGKGAVT